MKKNNKSNYRFCQRCGYPTYDKNYVPGTLSNNEKSDKYCNRCLDKGEFRHPEMNRQEMLIMIIDISLKSGWWVGKVMKNLFPKQIKKMEYWKDDNTPLNKNFSSEQANSNREKYLDYYKFYEGDDC